MPYYHILFETPEYEYDSNWFDLCDKQADSILEHFLDLDINVLVRQWSDHDPMKILTWSVEFSVGNNKLVSFLEKTKSPIVRELLDKYDCIIQKL